LTAIWLLIPNAFLQLFDEAIQGIYPTRSEAIRRGMNLILEEVRQRRSMVKVLEREVGD